MKNTYNRCELFKTICVLKGKEEKAEKLFQIRLKKHARHATNDLGLALRSRKKFLKRILLEQSVKFECELIIMCYIIKLCS